MIKGIIKAISGAFTKPEAPKPQIMRAGIYDVYKTTRHARHFAPATVSGLVKAAHEPAVRQDIIAKARYEVANNPLLQHLLHLHTAYLVGQGVRLQVQTGSNNYNNMVESTWERWERSRKFGEMLHKIVASRIVDGEVFLKIYDSDPVSDFLPVTLALQQIPPENVTQRAYDPKIIDGIKLNEREEVVGYWILPGSRDWYFSGDPMLIDKKNILHWFNSIYCFQYRAVSELAPVLDLCAQMRRYIDAVVNSAEIAAQFSVLLKTKIDPVFQQDRAAGGDIPQPLSSVEISPGMMTVLPDGYDIAQLDPKQPPGTFDVVIQYMIAEIGRAVFGMPYNIAAADSREANFSSARIDHLLYQRRIGVERRSCESSILEPLFRIWYEETSRANGWQPPYDVPPRHTWVWPSFPAIQPEIAAEAAKTELSIGLTHRRAILAERGLDIEDEDSIAANDLGISVEEYRRQCAAALHNIAVSMPPKEQEDQGDQNNAISE